MLVTYYAPCMNRVNTYQLCTYGYYGSAIYPLLNQYACCCTWLSKRRELEMLWRKAKEDNGYEHVPYTWLLHGTPILPPSCHCLGLFLNCVGWLFHPQKKRHAQFSKVVPHLLMTSGCFMRTSTRPTFWDPTRTCLPWIVTSTFGFPHTPAVQCDTTGYLYGPLVLSGE